MEKMYDIDGKELVAGSVIKFDTTVNGYNTYVVPSLDPLKIKYCSYNSSQKSVIVGQDYEYDKESLLAPSPFTGDREFTIIDHISNLEVIDYIEENPVVVESTVTIIPKVVDGFKPIKKLSVERSIKFLLEKVYLLEWVDIDGMRQHPFGLNFDEWCDKNGLFDFE